MEMSSSDADRLFDEQEYAAARELYRAEALRRVPAGKLFYTMHLAHELDELQFLEQISRRYSDQVECQLAYITCLIEQRAAARAVDECNNLLGIAIQTPHEITIRFLRVRAALLNPKWSGTLSDDLLNIWELAQLLPQPTSSRRTLLTEIVKISTSAFIPALRDIVEDQAMPTQMTRVVRAKLTELEGLSDVVENPGSIPESENEKLS
jgi:hypothetical protein